MKQNKSRAVKWMIRALTTVSVAVVYYVIFSVLFDTPIEHELKTSSEKLTRQYEQMETEYDSIQAVLNNLSDRDSAVYRLIYETEAYVPAVRNTASKVQLHEALSEKTNRELGDDFAARLSGLSQRVYAGRDVIGKLKAKVDTASNDINSIPSIQPVDNTELTALATSFGRRINPFYKTMQQHDGVDYNVPQGTAVFATADGVISQIQTRGSNNGLSMTIDHGNGYTTTYSYLSRTYGHVGQRVGRGDVIAFSGHSGMSFAPHLHYEVRLRGKAVDPLAYMFLELDIHKYETMRAIASHAMQAFD